MLWAAVGVGVGYFCGGCCCRGSLLFRRGNRIEPNTFYRLAWLDSLRGLVYFSYWMRCTDDGLEFSKDNRFILNLITVLPIAYVLLTMLWSATKASR